MHKKLNDKVIIKKLMLPNLSYIMIFTNKVCIYLKTVTILWYK